MDLSTLINECVKRKTGNKEFALFFIDGEWSAEIGNPNWAVRLGEVPGDIVAKAADPVSAVTALLAEINKGAATLRTDRKIYAVNGAYVLTGDSAPIRIQPKGGSGR